MVLHMELRVCQLRNGAMSSYNNLHIGGSIVSIEKKKHLVFSHEEEIYPPTGQLLPLTSQRKHWDISGDIVLFYQFKSSFFAAVIAELLHNVSIDQASNSQSCL